MNPKQLKVCLAENGMTLMAFLAHHLQLSNHKAKALLDARGVFVNGQRIWMARHRLEPGDRVEVQEGLMADARQALPGQTGRPAVSLQTILYQTNDYLVANKPAGLLANGPQSLEAALRHLLGNPVLTAVHRLDRDTSGCLLFARNVKADARIRPLFAHHQIRKIYHAVVGGYVAEREKEINYSIEHRSALTLIKTLDANKRASHLWIELKTGRTHQIRRHMVAIGHPLLGDQQYATRRELSFQERTVRRQMLHAYELDFRHPVTGQHLHAKAELPDDFTACLRQFGLT